MATASNRAMTKFETDFLKRYGSSSYRTPVKRKYKTVSTGSLTLDYAMGCGGLIVGRICEYWGPESVAKTTMGLIALANFQKAFPSRLTGWIDMERTFDEEWAELNGVDLKKIRVLRPHSAEDVSDMSRDLLGSGYFSFVGLDSIGGMVTEEEMEKDAAKSAMGTAAQVTTRMVKQAAVMCDDNDASLLVINQVRANMSYGADTQSSGAWALKHVSTHKIKLKKTSTPPYELGGTGNKVQVGMEISAVVEKNKVAPPRRVATFAIFNQTTDEYGPVGVDKASEAFVMGKRLLIIDQQPGGYYVLPGIEDRVRGEEKVKELLRSDAKLLERVRKEMLDRIRDQVKDDVPEDAGAENETSGELDLDFAQGTPELVDA